MLSADQHHQHCQHRKGQPCNVQGPHLDTWWLTGGNLILPRWTQSQLIRHEFLHCKCACVCVCTVCTKTFLSDNMHLLKSIDGMSLANLQTLFCQDARGSRRLHGRYPPADYCKSQVFEILPTTGCAARNQKKDGQLGASIFFY